MAQLSTESCNKSQYSISIANLDLLPQLSHYGELGQGARGLGQIIQMSKVKKVVIGY